MSQKIKLSINEQIDYMREQGIKFDVFSEEKAKKFLKERNYYFKIKIFSKNYKKNLNGKYHDLDFAYLRRFSILDTTFRDLILEISLTCEHLLKTSLCSLCAENINDDGYKVVNKYLAENKLPKEIQRYDNNKTSVYSADLLARYRQDFAVWNFVEVLSFNELLSFYDFYIKYFFKKSNVNIFNLYAIKSLRNVAAHNNCVLNTLTMRPLKNFKVSFEVRKILKDMNLLSSRGNVFKVPMIHDFLCLIFVFNKFCPSVKMNEIVKDKIEDFFIKFEKKENYYTNSLIIERYRFIKDATRNLLSYS